MKKIIFSLLAVSFLPVLSANAAINSLNGLSGTTQTFVNDTNVKITSSGTTHTLGWQSLLSLVRGGTNNGSFTVGGLIFASSSKLTQDAVNLFYASSSIRLGIGTNVPAFRLDVQGGQINASGGLCIASSCKTSWLQIASGSLNYIPKFSGQSSLVKSQLFDNGTNVGIGTASPSFTLDVNGIVKATEVKTNTISAVGTNQSLSLNPTGTGKVLIGGDSIVLASKSSDPSGPKAGQVYFNNTTNQFLGFNGTTWITLGSSPSTNKSIDLEHDTTQYLSVADSPSLSITDNMTVEFWVKPESQPGTNINWGLVSKIQTPSNQASFALLYEDNSGTKRLKFDFFEENDTDPSKTATYDITLSTSTWTHIATTYASGTIKIYINGIEVTPTSTSGSGTSIADSTADFRIGNGNNPATTNNFDGLIDDVRVWSIVRTQTEINDNKSIELTGSESNLNGYWKLDNDFTDATANNNDLTNNNSAAFSTDTAF